MIFSRPSRSIFAFACFSCVVWTTSSASAETYVIADADGLSELQDQLAPGDVIELTNGTWTDQELRFSARGTEAAPITLRAQTPGGVVITGESNLSISGEWLIVSGLAFENATPGNLSHIVQFRGSLGDATHCRLTESSFVACNPEDSSTRYTWVSLYGQHNRVDHCSFAEQNHSGLTVCVWLSTDNGDGDDIGVQDTFHRIDHNYFRDRAPGDGNGFETVRIGTSSWSHLNARVTVDHNLFERVDGEIEIISNKSNDNTFIGNTFRACAGTLTLRHGHRAVVEGNWFLGEGKEDSGGIRVIGEDHRIVNNYFHEVDDRADGAISITAGIRNTAANGYQQVKNVLIAHNTIVNTDGPAITLDWGFGRRERLLLAENVTIANNLIICNGEVAFEGQEGADWNWSGNLVFSETLGIPAQDGIQVGDWNIIDTNQGALAVAAQATQTRVLNDPNAIALEAAPETDITGIPRDDQPDIGAIEVLSAPANPTEIPRTGPLSPSDVGPSWQNE